MIKSLLLPSLFIFTLSLQAQKDTINTVTRPNYRSFIRETSGININIYPVPVREKTFTIKTDKDISIIKVTNMIGQDIYRAQYKNPLQLTRVFLENPKRGIYLVTIIFSDGLRVVKKVMVEETE